MCSRMPQLPVPTTPCKKCPSDEGSWCMLQFSTTIARPSALPKPCKGPLTDHLLPDKGQHH